MLETRPGVADRLVAEGGQRGDVGEGRKITQRVADELLGSSLLLGSDPWNTREVDRICRIPRTRPDDRLVARSIGVVAVLGRRVVPVGGLDRRLRGVRAVVVGVFVAVVGDCVGSAVDACRSDGGLVTMVVAVAGRRFVVGVRAVVVIGGVDEPRHDEHTGDDRRLSDAAAGHARDASHQEGRCPDDGDGGEQGRDRVGQLGPLGGLESVEPGDTGQSSGDPAGDRETR